MASTPVTNQNLTPAQRGARTRKINALRTRYNQETNPARKAHITRQINAINRS